MAERNVGVQIREWYLVELTGATAEERAEQLAEIRAENPSAAPLDECADDLLADGFSSNVFYEAPPNGAPRRRLQISPKGAPHLPALEPQFGQWVVQVGNTVTVLSDAEHTAQFPPGGDD